MKRLVGPSDNPPALRRAAPKERRIEQETARLAIKQHHGAALVK